MRILKIAAWIGMIAVFFVMRHYGQAFTEENVPGIIPLEFAAPAEGQQILASWNNANHPQLGNVLEVGKRTTWVDFLFLLFYTIVLASLSNSRTCREQNPMLNRLLRMNIFLAILAGLLDLAENIVLLCNMNNFSRDISSFTSVYWLALPKFILAAWVILVWLVSVMKGMFVRKEAVG